MNLRPYRTEEVDINITPLIDVVFLLLIFFMVSTTFVHESEIELTLPDASEEIRHEAIDKIAVAIDKNGQLFINGQALINSQLDTIKQALLQAIPKGVDPVVILSADAQATHQMVISVMDAARQAGLYRVTFPTNIAAEH